MNILGINSFFEHPSVALVRDGELVFALEDERLTRIKHGKRYTPYRTYVPFDSIHAALKSEGLCARDLDEIAYSYSGWDHLLGLWACLVGRRLSSLRQELAAFRTVRNVPRALREGYELPESFRSRVAPEDLRSVKYSEWNHHLSHAASAFFCSGFPEALVVVSDGSGEHACTSVYVGREGKLQRIDEVSLPHSLGLFYSFVTRHLGFEPFSDEYKVMALAAYGEPRYRKEVDRLIRLEDKGRYRVHVKGLLHLSELLGPRRAQGAPLTQAHRDVASSTQRRLEEVLDWVVGFHLRATGVRRLCLAGGTFLNCVANGRLARLDGVDDLFVQPAAHDGGTAIGAAALSWARRGGAPQLRFSSMALGTEYGDAEIEIELAKAGTAYHRVDAAEMANTIADRLARGDIGAIFRGRMEFGPRALGMRSLLASPCLASTRDRLNTIKGRETFRPVAPIVREENFSEYFDGRPNVFMLLTCRVREAVRSRIPSAVHIDGSARVQVVTAADDPFLHDLLGLFEKRAGVPVIINTSFNSRGQPIVESPADALACFYTSNVDFLVLGRFLVQRAA